MSKEKKPLVDIKSIKKNTLSAFKGASEFASSSVALPKAFMPVVRLLMTDRLIEREELSLELDKLFEQLYLHPVSSHSR